MKKKNGRKLMVTVMMVILSVLILMPVTWGDVVRVKGIVSYEDGGTTYPQHAELRFHQVSEGIIQTYAWEKDMMTDADGYYQTYLNKKDWVVEINDGNIDSGKFSKEYRIFVLINVDGLTSESITLGPWREINVTAQDRYGNPFANQEVRVTKGEGLPLTMNIDDLWCGYWDGKVTNASGDPVTLLVPPTTVTTMDGTKNIQIKSDWLYLYQASGDNTANPTQITVTDGGDYIIQAGQGQWVQFECLDNNGANLWDITTDYKIGARLRKEGFFIELGDMVSAGGLYPYILLQCDATHQIAVRAKKGTGLPGYFDAIIGRDFFVDASTTSASLSLSPTIEIGTRTAEEKEFQAIRSYLAEGSGDIYRENIVDYKEFDTATTCTLRMFENQRILIEVWPVDSDLAKTEFRKYLPTAASLEGAKLQLDDIVFYKKNERILAASPSQIRKGETGTIVVAIVADEIQYLIDNNLLHQLVVSFARDITINSKGYVKSITLADGITAHIFYLGISVNPEAETGYVPLTVSRGSKSITCNYVLEVINNEQQVQPVTSSGYSIKSSRSVLAAPSSMISQPCIVSQGSFDVTFPQPSSSIPQPTVAATDKAVSGWRILEQADVTVEGYTQFPSDNEYQLTTHFVPDTLYGLNRNDLVVFHRDQSNRLTKLPIILEGPPTAIDVVARTKLLGNISLAIRDSDFTYETPTAAQHWGLYR